MRTILYINDTICSSLEQLRNTFSKNLVPGTPLYEDLLTLQRDGELAQWLAEGNTEEEENLSIALNALPSEQSNRELIHAMTEIILGKGVNVSKPNYSSFFQITNIRCEVDNGMVVFSGFRNLHKEIQGIIHSLEQTKTSTYCRDVKSRPYMPELNVFESKFFIDVKIKRIDNESFTIRLVEKDGYELGCKKISLYDKKVGQIVTIEIKADIDISYDFSLKVDDYQFCDISIKKDVSPFSLYMGKMKWENQPEESEIDITIIDDNDSKNLHEVKEDDMIVKVKDVCFKMIFVKGGTFTMGATYEQGSSAESREHPNHIVKLSSYYIGETVVTQELWQILMGDNPSEYKGLQYPIQNITWYRCQDFIKKLNDLTEKQFRLPTEAEWEFAARGGISSHNYKYAGSNDMNKVGWSNRRGGEGPHPVAQKCPNELGIYDMSGNESEWCSDWYGKYSSESQNDPVGPAWGTQKVARSGDWMTSDSVSRVTCRRRWDPSCYGNSFRLALSCNSNESNNSDNNFIESPENGIDSNDETDYLDNGWPIDGDWPWYNP